MSVKLTSMQQAIDHWFNEDIDRALTLLEIPEFHGFLDVVKDVEFITEEKGNV